MKKNTRINISKKRRAASLIMIVGSILVIGVLLTAINHAASNVISLETESGSLKTNAVSVSKTDASAGRYVKFTNQVQNDIVIMASGDFNGGTEAGRTFATMRAQNPAAVLGLGDFQYNGSSVGDPATGGFNTQIGNLKTITYPTAGPTHDTQGTSPDGPYKNYWGRSPYDMYSFDLGNWHIISLPSAIFRYNVNVVGIQTQLDADLAANKKPCTLAFWHEPYWTLPTSGHLTRDAPGELAWMKSLYNNNADLILTGHQHDYQRFGPNDPNGNLDNARGIPQFIVGNGGVGFYTFKATTGDQAPNLLFHNDNTYGALKLVLHSNSYDFALLPNGGGPEIDKGSGTCH